MSFASELRHARDTARASPPQLSSAWQFAGKLATASPTSRPFLKAFGCAAVAYGLCVLLVLGGVGAGGTGDLAIRTLVALAVACALPAVLTGILECQSPRAWPLWRIGLTFLPMFSLAAVLHTAGAVTG